KCKAEFKKTGEVPSGYSFVWDILAKRGLVDDSKGFKLTLIGHAKKQESMRKKGLAEVIRNNEKRYVSIAKRIGIENYFKKNTEKDLRNKRSEERRVGKGGKSKRMTKNQEEE